MAPAMAEAPNAELVAVAGRDAGRTEAFARRHGVRDWYVHASDFYRDADVDAVYVSTPVDRHAADVEAAARAGRDILVEKPIARSADEAADMIDVCAAAGVRLATCFYQRCNARHRRIRDLLRQGAIGRVTTARMNFSSRLAGRPDAWRLDHGRSGGGSFIDLASHCVDLVRYLLGEVDEVIALTDTLAGASDVEDTASVLLRLADSRVQVVLTAHWSTTDPSLARTSVLEIGGTEGTIVSWPLHDKHSRGTLVLATADGEQPITVEEASTHVTLLEDLAAARARGEPFPITGEDGVAAQNVVDAVYELARTGWAVSL